MSRTRIDGELSSRPLTGGDLGRARWVETTSGPVVEKTYPGSLPAGLVAAEAAGLTWRSVADGPPVPAVRTPGRRQDRDPRRGRGRVHCSRCDAFGAALARLPDAVGPLRTGRRSGGAGHRFFSARVHGDLWSGNVLWDRDGTAWLIDPAAHGGHPELDLALLALFGAPQLDRVLAAYEVAAGSGLADGWRERLPLHQVHTLLFHAIAFGGGYLARTLDVVRRYL